MGDPEEKIKESEEKESRKIEKARTSEERDKSKSKKEMFYLKALEGDLVVRLNGIKYVFQAGQVLAVPRTPGNIAVFKKDVAAKRFEIISEERYRKLSDRKIAETVKTSSLTDEDFEAMLDNVGKRE